MKNFFESFLLSILFSISVLLGLSFWLNVKFGFNLFCIKHWDELSKLQATHAPISFDFYLSIAIAIFILIAGLYMIFKPKFKKISEHNIEKETKESPVPKINVPQPETLNITKTDNIVKTESTVQKPQIDLSRPHRLNLPRNIHEIAAVKHAAQPNPQITIPYKDTTEYNDTLAEIFKNNNYTVKTNPVISGFTPNLFAIGANEVLWIGAIDCDIDKIKNSIKKLSDVFSETLSDIEINIKAFLIDSFKRYDSNDEIKIFHTMEELKQFVSDNPGEKIEDDEQENFNAYSEYIDTVIKYIKNV